MQTRPLLGWNPGVRALTGAATLNPRGAKTRRVGMAHGPLWGAVPHPMNAGGIHTWANSLRTLSRLGRILYCAFDWLQLFKLAQPPDGSGMDNMTPSEKLKSLLWQVQPQIGAFPPAAAGPNFFSIYYSYA